MDVVVAPYRILYNLRAWRKRHWKMNSETNKMYQE